MEERLLDIVDSSLQRCIGNPRFLDRFYERFLASSPKVKERFERTDFVKQKRALRGSLWMMLLAAANEAEGPDRYLRYLADLHSARQLDIGAELYDLWLDCLLETLAECDPAYSPELRAAWEQVMMVGIHYLCTRYNR
jgi:hemoglobin-like flavoprotein